MSNPIENNDAASANASADTSTNLAVVSPKTDAGTPPPAMQATLTINSEFIVNLFIGLLGVGAVAALFRVLQYVGSLFAATMPYIFGGILFATLVATFFVLLRSRKTMRRSAKLRVSLSEAYTAVSVFVVMGYFATACMHAFQADGLAAGLWTHGVTAVAFSLLMFGFGRGVSSLWEDGKKSR